MAYENNFADPLNDISDINMNDSNIYGLDNDSKGPNEITTGESAWANTESPARPDTMNKFLDDFRPGFPPGFG